MEFTKLIIICSNVLIASNIFGKTEMPILALKQQIHSSRFVSKNGKYTYYQNSAGKLLLSTNFNVKPILTGDDNTNYQIYSSPARKKIVITQDQNHHNFLGIRKPKKIFVSDFGVDSVSELGIGSTPQLHLDDNWVSYYQMKGKSLLFQNLKNPAIKFQIKLVSEVNPYFVPTSIMIDEKKIIFTDVNERGFPGLIEFNRNTNKTRLLFKGNSPQEKIELCAGANFIAFGLFPLVREGGSVIYTTPKDKPSFDTPTIVYDSSNSDIGNLLCAGSDIYFIKKTKKSKTELALIRKNKVKLVSNLGNVSQVISMDGNILIPHQANFYIVSGNENLDQDNLDDTKKK